MRAIRWACVVGYGKLHPIRAAALAEMPYSAFFRLVHEWSARGEIIIDGWKVLRCSQCGKPYIEGMRHKCAMRTGRPRKGIPKNIENSWGSCKYCGEVYFPKDPMAKNTMGYCSVECREKAKRKVRRRKNGNNR